MNKLQKIKEACIKANTEIAEQPCTHKLMADENGCPFGVHEREIRLADVLLAIGEKDVAFSVTQRGNFVLLKESTTMAVQVNGKNLVWNLKETLDNQSPETIDFIFKTLE